MPNFLITPLLIAVKAAFWAPVGMVLLPALDAIKVVFDALVVIAKHSFTNH